IAGANDLLPARVMRIALISLGFQLLAGELHFGGIDDDDKFARIRVRRVHRAVLAPQNIGDFHREPADYFVGSIDDKPTLFDIVAVGHERGHWRVLPSSGLARKYYDKVVRRGVKGRRYRSQRCMNASPRMRAESCNVPIKKRSVRNMTTSTV